LTVVDDALTHIRRHPKMYLQSDTAKGSELASLLGDEVLVATGEQAEVSHESAWWVVASRCDWLDLQAGTTLKDMFTKMIPFPRAGAKSMRREVLLTAFARDVVTRDGESSCIIKGDVENHDLIWPLMWRDKEWQRVVAFRLEENAG